MHQALRRRARRCARRRSRRSSARRASDGEHGAAALADDRPAHAEGLDRARRRSTASQIEGSWRSHQVPLADVARQRRSTSAQLEEWLRSYRPEELFDDDGRLVPELAALAPEGDRRMSANPHANGGALLRDLAPARLPRLRGRGADSPATTDERGDARPRRLPARRRRPERRTNFRLFGPDETASNRLGDVFAVTDRAWHAEIEPTRRGPRARTAA